MRTNNYEAVDGSKLRIGIVRARFNEAITQGMLDGALRVLEEAKVKDIQIVEVPGSFELPVVAAKLAKKGRVDAIISLGCIIKGETSHDHHLAVSVMGALQEVAMKYYLPVTASVLTVDNIEQAKVRSGSSEMNRGTEGARVALEMVNKMKKLS